MRPETNPPSSKSLWIVRGLGMILLGAFAVGTVLSFRKEHTRGTPEPSPMTLVTPAAERYGAEDTTGWFRGALSPEHAPVDLSFLNERPAGTHGFLRVQGDRLIFEDGTPARFWGGNIAAHALFVSKQEIEQQARRMARLGFNVVRLHHHDSISWVSPTVIDKTRDDTQRLNLDGLDCIDYWIKCLRDEGIYIWLDLHVGRTLKEGDRASPFGPVAGFDEILRQEGRVHGFCYFNENVRRLMQEFNAQYLSHVNAHTGLAYKDDPAIITVLVTNENDLTRHFGNLMLADKNNPVHRAMFQDALRRFCSTTGLPLRETERTWLPGPSKIFLNDQEHQFNTLMMQALRDLGVRVPVATTNSWGHMGVSSLPALAGGDIIDVHSYGEADALSANPLHKPNYLSWIAAAQVQDKPLSVSEWNVPYPARDRFTAPLYVASVAALQGWDAIMIYGYSQQAFRDPTRISKWSTFLDPAIMGVMPAAALAYRRGDVRPARHGYCLVLDREKTYFRGIDAATSTAIRTLAEKSRLTIGLPDIPELEWDTASSPPAGIETFCDPEQEFIDSKQEWVESDTGELRRDWSRGVFTVDTPRTQAAAGWFDGREVHLADVRFRVATPEAVVIVSSVEAAPIRESGRILVTAVARAVLQDDQLPFYSEPVTGEIAVRARSGLDVYALQSDGQRTKTLETSYRQGFYWIPLDRGVGTHWLMLECAPKEEP